MEFTIFWLLATGQKKIVLVLSTLEDICNKKITQKIEFSYQDLKKIKKSIDARVKLKIIRQLAHTHKQAGERWYLVNPQLSQL